LRRPLRLTAARKKPSSRPPRTENRLHPQIHYLRALVLLHTDNVDQALASLRQAVYCDPTFALAHYSLAELYQDRGERKEAARHLRLAQAAIVGLEPIPAAYSKT
jgi:Tfp pilus assembly protein PilF